MVTKFFGQTGKGVLELFEAVFAGMFSDQLQVN
jgi:hypothetical protein